VDLNEAKKTIRDLLNRANDDASSELEIDAALKFSRRLMLRHNISEDECLETTRDPHEVAADTEYGRTEAYPVATRLTEFETCLAYAIQNLVGTVKWYRQSTGNQHDQFTAKTPYGTVQFDENGNPRTCYTKLVFYGPASDSRDAADLFTTWAVTIVAMSRAKHGGFVRGAGRSYAEGFATSLRQKVANINRDEEKRLSAPTNNGESRELVLLGEARSLMKAKSERAVSWLEEECHIKLRNIGGSRSNKTFDHDAYNDGRSDGQKANFTHSRAKAITG